jgi:hypothetical protein
MIRSADRFGQCIEKRYLCMQQTKKPLAGDKPVTGSKHSEQKKAPQAEQVKKPAKAEAPKKKF